MSVIIFVNVAMRYLTSNSLEWAEEVSRHMMIWLTFLGAGPVLRYGGHIAVENLQDALPAKRGHRPARRGRCAALRLLRLHGLVRLALHGAHHVPAHRGHADSVRLYLQRDARSAACC